MKHIFEKPQRVQRVFRMYFPLLFLITMLFSFSLLKQSRESLLSYALLYAQKSNEVMQASFSQAAEQIAAQVSQLTYDSSFRAVMEAERYSDVTPDMLDDFMDTVSTKANLPSGALISMNSQHTRYSPIFLNSQMSELEEKMPGGKTVVTLGLFSPEGTLNGKHYLVFGSNYFAKGNKIGAVFITLNPNDFVASLAISSQPGVSFLLTDAAGGAVLLNSSDAGKTIEDFQRILSGKGGAQYVTEQLRLSELDCTLYSIVDTATILAPVRSMYKTSFMALALLILISLGGNIYLGRALIRPLIEFKEYLSGLRSDRKLLSGSAVSLKPSGCAEIQEIEAQFSALLDSIAALNTEVQQKAEDLHQSQLLRKDMEIRNLRSQINPHFLYNTLEMIRADATAGRIDQVSATTAAMGKIYRYSVKGAAMVTLKEEIEHVKAYMTIQQERFNGKITMLYNISEEAEKVLIPKMILQPLVENAFIHGLEPAGGTGILYVGADVHQGALRISVRDSGIGIPPERLAKLERQMHDPAPERDSIGLANVRERLRLQYGSASVFRMESTPDDGTCIYLDLPAEETETP